MLHSVLAHFGASLYIMYKIVEMTILLILIQVIHILVWIFIATAFLNKRLAYINVYYLIPLTYLSHVIFNNCILGVAEKTSRNLVSSDEATSDKAAPEKIEPVFLLSPRQDGCQGLEKLHSYRNYYNHTNCDTLCMVYEFYGVVLGCGDVYCDYCRAAKA